MRQSLPAAPSALGWVMPMEISPKTLRQLAAAEGYLDLGMPQHALDELTEVDESGPLEAPVQLLRGEALKALEKYGEAIAPLQRAAQLIPAPHNKAAWMSLSECFRLRGQIELADVVEAFASTDTPVINVSPVINITISIQGQDAEALDEEIEPNEFDGDPAEDE